MKQKSKLAPRNPLVAPCLFRKAGAHDKTHKAKRRSDKVSLHRELSLTPVLKNSNDWRCSAASHPFEFSVPE